MPGAMTPPAGMGRSTGGTRLPDDGAGAIACGCDGAAVAWGSMEDEVWYDDWGG